jgi:transposase
MSLKVAALPALPAETVKVARAAFPQGNRYMRMRDEFGSFYCDEDFADLYGQRGRPGESAWRLALISVFAYVEELSDEQAAEAVRSRIDWKYALSLELTDSGFDAAVLSEFRTRLVAGSAEQVLLDNMLACFSGAGYLNKRGRQRTDSTHVLAAVRCLNRLMLVGETVRHALNVLATSAPSWLQSHLQAEWLERYAKRFEEYRLPAGKAARAALASQMGDDGCVLLKALYAEESPRWLREVEAVRILQRVWLEQYVAVADEQAMCWRAEEDLPPAAQRLHTPYDPEARYASKRSTTWLGYKVHLSESCDEEGPDLITNVLTTPATTPDFEAAAPIHAHLASKALLPAEHLLDAGYVDGGLLVESQTDYQIEVIGPVAPDHCWQALTPEAFAIAHFFIDWEAKQVICPQGHCSQKWSQTHDQQRNPIINIRFAPANCAACPVRTRCTRSPNGPRHLTLRPQAQHLAIQQRRRAQETPAFQQTYAKRAGIEGTLSQAVRTTGLRRTRYIGLAKTSLQHILSAAALNLYRITDWLAERPLAFTRTSAFSRLALAP